MMQFYAQNDSGGEKTSFLERAFCCPNWHTFYVALVTWKSAKLLCFLYTLTSYGVHHWLALCASRSRLDNISPLLMKL